MHWREDGYTEDNTHPPRDIHYVKPLFGRHRVNTKCAPDFDPMLFYCSAGVADCGTTLR